MKKIKNLVKTIKYVGCAGLLSVVSGCAEVHDYLHLRAAGQYSAVKEAQFHAGNDRSKGSNPEQPIFVLEQEDAPAPKTPAVVYGLEEFGPVESEMDLFERDVFVLESMLSCLFPKLENTSSQKQLPALHEVMPVAGAKPASLDSVVSAAPEDSLPAIPQDSSSSVLGAGLLFAMITLAGTGIYVGAKYALKKKLPSTDQIKKSWAFLKSLPELSRPGITVKNVADFIGEYSPGASALSARIAANKFMEVLPDANQFSRLELMLLANAITRYKPSEKEFYTGICGIIENYDRAVVDFDELLRSVQKHNSSLSDAVEKTRRNLASLNAHSGKPDLFAFKKEYYACILRGARALEKNSSETAVKHFRTALDLNKRRSEAYFGLADAYQQRGSFVEAIEIMDELIRASPCRLVLSKAYFVRASCFVKMGNARAALDNLAFVDDSDCCKYALARECESMLGGRSVFRAVKDFFKKGYRCYVQPALRYWAVSGRISPAPALSSALQIAPISEEVYAKLSPAEIYRRFKECPDSLTSSQKERFVDRLYNSIDAVIKAGNDIAVSSKEALALVDKYRNLAHAFKSFAEERLKQEPRESGKIGFVPS